MQSSGSQIEATSARRRFRVILVKPSHYDDDGYVIRWFRSTMPSNSLASVYGLAADAAGRRVLGPDVTFDITAKDREQLDAIYRELTACKAVLMAL